MSHAVMRRTGMNGQSAMSKLFRRRPLREYVDLSSYVHYARKQLGIPAMSSDDALRNLVDVAAALHAKDVPYSLAFGTLLGAVREGQFIRHDYDTDLTVPADSFDPGVLLDLRRRGFHIRKFLGFPDDGMYLSLIRSNVSTDLGILYPRDGGMYLSEYSDYRGGTAKWIDYLFPKLDYGWMEFMGHQFRAPKEPEVFLRCSYGDSWRTPDKNWHGALDPPNAAPRAERLNLAASGKAIAEYIQSHTGMSGVW
jgi:lipopolysaccharide cholinephosphotransferase